MLKWEETTNEKVGAECWTLEVPVLDFDPITVKVHRNPDNPNEKVWYLSCFNPTIARKQLWASELGEAQREALQYLHEVINAMDTAIGAAAMDDELVYAGPGATKVPDGQGNTMTLMIDGVDRPDLAKKLLAGESITKEELES